MSAHTKLNGTLLTLTLRVPPAVVVDMPPSVTPAASSRKQQWRWRKEPDTGEMRQKGQEAQTASICEDGMQISTLLRV
jgi:hypothetical protein